MNSRSYLSFSGRERAGIIALVVILLIVWAAGLYRTLPRPAAQTVILDTVQVEMHARTDMPAARTDDQRSGFANRDRYQQRPYHAYRSWKASPRPRETFGRSNTDKPRLFPQRSRRLEAPAVVEINTADTTAFIALPGIGSKLAARIVSFRSSLGGFTSVDQIGQVYGLKDSVFQVLLPYLKCDSVYANKPYASITH